MKKVVILADILLAVLFGLFLCVETMSVYIIGSLFLVILFLITEILIILYASEFFKILKWFVNIFTVSIPLAHLPKAFLLVALSQYEYLLFLIILFVVSLFRIVCSFRVVTQ